MDVEFVYWGTHEIFARLAREEHAGRRFFWFHENQFSLQWFSDHLKESIANAGDRYTPHLNIELPIAKLFDGLGRTENYYKGVKQLHDTIKREYLDGRYDEARYGPADEKITTAYAELYSGPLCQDKIPSCLRWLVCRSLWSQQPSA
jgi:hypothetical protein